MMSSKTERPFHRRVEWPMQHHIVYFRSLDEFHKLHGVESEEMSCWDKIEKQHTSG